MKRKKHKSWPPARLALGKALKCRESELRKRFLFVGGMKITIFYENRKEIMSLKNIK